MEREKPTILDLLPALPFKGPPLPGILGIKWPGNTAASVAEGELQVEKVEIIAPKRILYLKDGPPVVQDPYEEKKREILVPLLYE